MLPVSDDNKKMIERTFMTGRYESEGEGELGDI